VIRLDLNGRPVSLDREVAVQLREAAARWAAKSSTVRDLSLILDQAIRTGRVVALQRQELRALAEVLGSIENREDLAELRDVLNRATNKSAD
jgi:hypothetical protein